MSLNHYVPNFNLKNFTDNTDTLWVMDKIDGRCFHNRSRRGRFDYAFAKHGYNPSVVEEVFAEIESKVSPIVEKVIDWARSGKYVELTSMEKGHLCTFLFVQSLRIPRVKNWVMSTRWEFESDREVLWQMFRDLCEDQYPVGLEAEKSNAEITEHPYFEKIIWFRMMDMNINVWTLNENACTSLLIGDEPCLKKGFLIKQGDFQTIPLAKDVYIELTRSDGGPGGRFELSERDVQDLNI